MKGARLPAVLGTLVLSSCIEGGAITDMPSDAAGDGPEAEEAEESTDSVQAGPSVRFHPGETKDAERVERLPVGRSEASAKRRVVMRLGPDQVPALALGDRIRALAEVQVTTRCDVGQNAPGCGYNPHVAARIIVTSDAADVDAAGAQSKALSSVKSLTCTRSEHHCMFVFGSDEATAVLNGGFDLPCVADDSCHVSLVMWAWHPDARAGGKDEVLVGSNEGDFLANGDIEGDRGRLAIIRERDVGASDKHTEETAGGGKKSVPTNASPIVVFSHRLAAPGGKLKKGEHYVVEAKMPVSASGRVRFSTLMVLTKNDQATSGGLQKTFPEEIGEHNGINCTAGASPCVVRKVSAFRVDEDIEGPVFVNVVVRSEVPGGGSANVEVDRGAGFARSVRYAASTGGG